MFIKGLLFVFFRRFYYFCFVFRLVFFLVLDVFPSFVFLLFPKVRLLLFLFSWPLFLLDFLVFKIFILRLFTFC